MPFDTSALVAETPTVERLIATQALRAAFQPIVNFSSGSIDGYEGLIRGPSGSLLETPRALFQRAEEEGCSMALELAAAAACVESFARLGLAGSLFLNFSANALEVLHAADRHLNDLCGTRGLARNRVVIELTEQSGADDPKRLASTVNALRESGARFALDDYGTANSSMNLWVRLTPDVVKIDRFFIDDIARDPLKREAVRAMSTFAQASGATLIAEGLERQADLNVIQDLGIACGQGFLLGRPAFEPMRQLPDDVRQTLQTARGKARATGPHTTMADGVGAHALDAKLIAAPCIEADASNDDVVKIFNQLPSLHAVAIVKNAAPIALINRRAFLEHYALPYHRELFAKRACLKFANAEPIVIERGTSMDEIARILANDDLRHVSDGVIVTEAGRYVGLLTGEDVIRALTDIRIDAARYANPLTLLPGNAPINMQIDRLIGTRTPFVACYVDLDDFKPFNDRYGYWQGDQVLKVAALALRSVCDPVCDFLGHVGGDDFLILFQSEDWAHRSQRAMAEFNEQVKQFYSADDRKKGGVHGPDRSGQRSFFGFVTMSIGAVCVEPDMARSSDEIGTVAAVAKGLAKQDEHGFVAIDFNAALDLQ